MNAKDRRDRAQLKHLEILDMRTNMTDKLEDDGLDDVHSRPKMNTRALAKGVVATAVPLAALGFAQTAVASGPVVYVGPAHCAPVDTAYTDPHTRNPGTYHNAAVAHFNCAGGASKGWVSATMVVNYSHFYATGSTLGSAEIGKTGLNGAHVSAGCVHWGRYHSHELGCASSWSG